MSEPCREQATVSQPMGFWGPRPLRETKRNTHVEISAGLFLHVCIHVSLVSYQCSVGVL